LIIPGKGSLDNLMATNTGVGKYGEYIDDRLRQDTI